MGAWNYLNIILWNRFCLIHPDPDRRNFLGIGGKAFKAN
jgi:hypothetical protein